MADVLVLGAGMVGVGSALALQAGGHQVTILERDIAGQPTSYGNAGIIQTEAAEPYPIPQDLPTLWKYASGLTNDIIYNLRDLPTIAPALWSYFRASAPGRHSLISQTYSKLTAQAITDHAPLVAASKSESLIGKHGYYHIHREAQAFDIARAKAERFHQTYGVSSKILDGQQLRAKEPALKANIAGAVHWDKTWSSSDPGALTNAYMRLFEERGGSVITGDARTLKQTKTGWQVQSDTGPIEASDVVVALGPWSPDLLKQFGYNIQMVWKRGYHAHYQMSQKLKRPMLDVANGVLLSSMTQGLRMTTGAELVNRNAPINKRQLAHGLKGAHELFDVGAQTSNQIWFGHRPCLPDMLPLVGQAPSHSGMWFNFGHGHQGFTLGPTTGNILAEMFDGKSVDVASVLSPTARLGRKAS